MKLVNNVFPSASVENIEALMDAQEISYGLTTVDDAGLGHLVR
jgi:hypothetical protein